MKLNFLKYILHQNKESLIYNVFKAQCESPTRGDWVTSVKKIMSDIQLNLTFEDIIITKNNYFRRLVKNKVQKFAFSYLVSKIKSKGKEIKYKSEFKCQVY